MNRFDIFFFSNYIFCVEKSGKKLWMRRKEGDMCVEEEIEKYRLKRILKALININ